MTLKEWRAANRKTLIELATEADVSDATISRIENGLQRPAPALAKRLEAITGIPAAVFVMGEAS